MKNFFKFLGIIALVAVIGFGVAACKGAEEEEEEEEGGGIYTGKKWPEDLFDDTNSLTKNRFGQYGTGGYYISFDAEYYLESLQSWTNAYCSIQDFGATPTKILIYDIESIIGKEIKLKKRAGGVVTLCTNYAVVGGRLYLTPADSYDALGITEETYSRLFVEDGIPTRKK